MICSEHAAKSDGSDETFTSWSVFNLQIKEKLSVAFEFFDVNFF